ncbi:MAG: TRAP transporter small permease subunit [Thiohalomonadales bacterium]
MKPLSISKYKQANEIVYYLDKLSEYTGRLVSWLVLLMVLIIFYDVSMRYVFKIGSVALQELEWHLFAVIFLLGAAYTFKHDAHVRVDVFYNSAKCSDYCRAWIDISGFIFLLLPFSILIISSASGFAYNAYLIVEGSPDPGGLPYRYIIKAIVPLAFILLILQGLSKLLLNAQVVIRHHRGNVARATPKQD